MGSAQEETSILTPQPLAGRQVRTRVKQLLRESQLFGGVGEDILDRLLEVGALYRLSPGTMLFGEGDAGDAMYLVLSGRLRIFTTTDGIEHTIAIRKRHEFVGEMALIEQQPRSASGAAQTQCRVFCLGGDEFRRLLATESTLALAVLSTVSNRARSALVRQKTLIKDLRAIHRDLALANRNLERRVRAKTRELGDANAFLRALAMRDGLTGVQNRRSFDDLLARMLAQASHDRRPFSLLMIDVDHFKQVNDVHGHQAGDRVLVEVARVAQNQLRSGQVLARYGGEEFAVLLPRVSQQTAVRKAEEIRRAVEAHAFPIRGARVGEIHVSLGVATCPDDASGAAELIQTADRCLYQAKEGGRNRVVAPPAVPLESIA